MLVCKYCGSDLVYYDAWVSVNDRKDVITFDNTFCMKCDDQCKLVEISNQQKESE